MGRIKDTMSKWARWRSPTPQAKELWSVVDSEIETLKQRVAALESALSNDGK